MITFLWLLKYDTTGHSMFAVGGKAKFCSVFAFFWTDDLLNKKEWPNEIKLI